MLVHHLAELAQVKNAGGGCTREKRCELNGNRSGAKQGLDKSYAVGFRFGHVGNGWPLAIRGPNGHLLTVAYGHSESLYTSCGGLSRVLTQFALRGEKQQMQRLLAFFRALHAQRWQFLLLREKLIGLLR